MSQRTTMETAAGGGGRVRKKRGKLTVEEYLFFVDDNKIVDLTVDQLNQIINFHGFKKIDKTPKKILYEVVNTMELMKPSRSTVHDAAVSSDAMMSLEHVIKDLNELGWQECCVSSLQRLNFVDSTPQDHLNAASDITTNLDSAGDCIDAAAADDARYGIVGSESASCSSVICGGGGGEMKMASKRKRSPRVVVNNDGDGVSNSPLLQLCWNGN